MDDYTGNDIDSYRIGNDIDAEVDVTIEDEAVSLEGRDLTVEVVDPYDKPTEMEFTTSGNTIYFTYKGKIQRHTGIYRVTIWINKGKDGQHVEDVDDAFRLCKTTKEVNNG